MERQGELIKKDQIKLIELWLHEYAKAACATNRTNINEEHQSIYKQFLERFRIARIQELPYSSFEECSNWIFGLVDHL